ncbi:MAG TPA: hypothetical protein PLS69_01575 [Terricaulis sp.]|nr:hypothetical protein [Terricaulis sp.]HRP11558.1 hypothetical protein [Terricaulis sp.]
MTLERITIDKFGLDEIVLDGVNVHVERMDANHVWIGLTRNGNRLTVMFSAERGAIRAVIEEADIGVAPTPKD